MASNFGPGTSELFEINVTLTFDIYHVIYGERILREFRGVCKVPNLHWAKVRPRPSHFERMSVSSSETYIYSLGWRWQYKTITLHWSPHHQGGWRMWECRGKRNLHSVIPLTLIVINRRVTHRMKWISNFKFVAFRLSFAAAISDEFKSLNGLTTWSFVIKFYL